MNFSTSSFRIHQNNDEYDPHHHPNHRVSSSSSSSSVPCHIFFNSSTQDRMGYYDHHYLYRPRQQEVENYAYLSGSSYEMKNKAENGLKLTLWKKEVDEHEPHIPDNTNNNYVKWNSNTKTSLTKKKTKNPEDRMGSKITKFEDEKMQPSSSFETDLSSKSDSYNNNSPIRVCADCNTTKTPLWRSGPKGPKSLCNACGIRQRKARRAMAAAASGTGVAATQPPPTKIKVQQHKEKIGKIGHASKLTKRRKNLMANTTTNTTKSPNYGQKKLRFEDFLINLSKNLSFHRVFPDDEKDAAILLMAISSGVFHG